MSEPIEIKEKEDVIVTSQVRVACEGPEDSRHPRIFLTMVDDKSGQPDHVVCPYCSRVFKYRGQ
jgi:uncharacterized Zn-finger protein